MTDEDDLKIEITSYNQSGGITAQNVTINNISTTPAPKLQSQEIFTNKLDNDKYHTRLQISVISPYPVGNLYIEVWAKTIVDMDFAPMRSDMDMQGHSGRREGFIFTNVPSAYGNYQLDIITTKQEKEFKIGCRFD